MILVGGVFFAMWYFLTYYFQFVLGYGPVKAGLAFCAHGHRHHHRRASLITTHQ